MKVSHDLPTSPPSVAALGRLLNSFDSEANRAMLISGSSGPWRERIGGLVQTIGRRWPDAAVFIETPLGLLPYTLEDVSPWAHLNGPPSIWNSLSLEDRAFDLEALVGKIQPAWMPDWRGLIHAAPVGLCWTDATGPMRYAQ